MSTLIINGTSSSTVTVLAAAAYTTTQTSDIYHIDQASMVFIEVDVTAASGTSPTLDVYLQTELPDGTNYADIAAFTQITGVARRAMSFVSGGNSEYLVTTATLTAGTMRPHTLGKFCRIVAKIGGTNPSFTMSINLMGLVG